MKTTPKSGPDRGRLKQSLDRPVTLVGMMGSGKTIIGKKLSQELDLPFIDSDARIVETAGISIAEIFEIAGEDKFRAMESDAISAAVDEGPAILSTGGGAICAADTGWAPEVLRENVNDFPFVSIQGVTINNSVPAAKRWVTISGPAGRAVATE